jgi:hypothetical protein
MACVKGTGTSVIASTASTTTSSAQDSSASYATEVYIDLVQVGTATTAAQVQIQVSPDAGTTYYSPPSLLWTAPLAAGTYDTVIQLPVSAGKWKAAYTQCVGGTSSTVVVQSNAVTGV